MKSFRLFWRLFWFFFVLCSFTAAATLLLSSATRANPISWLLGTAVVAAASIVAFCWIRRVIQPLEELARSVQEVVSTEADISSSFPTQDEFAKLASDFQRVRRRLGDRLIQAEVYAQRLATVLGSMMEGVLAVDNQERILFANDASRELLDAKGRDIEGRPLLEATRNRAMHDAVAKAFSSERSYETEFQSTGANRRTIWLRAARLPGDPSPGIVAVLQDITELRRLENLRRDFVANVSHELKTPLASIKAYAETLRLGAIHDRDHNLLFVTQIEEQADRLHQLILDLLHLARVEAGREAFEITNLSLAEVAMMCLSSHSQAASSKQIDLKVLETSDLEIRADFDGVQTIIDNLISNAINYTPAGGRVTVGWRQDAQTAVIEIEDTGIGIDVAHQDRVFERFYRVDRARSRELGGTGLGLSIVKHLVHAFGGTVALRSELGKGSKFTVRIPLAGS